MSIHSGVKYLFLFFTSLLEDFMNQHLRSLWRTSCSAALGLVLAAVSSFAGNSAQPSPLVQAKDVSTARANSILAKAGLEFVENKGQVVDTKGNARPDIKFSAASKGVGVFFTSDRIIYSYTKTEGKLPDIRDAKPKEHFTGINTTLYRLDMSLVGASSSANIVPNNQLPGVQNFYTANTGFAGVTGVRGFNKLTYENVYPNIDMVLLTHGKGMKAEFVVRPGGDPSMIKMHFDGAKSVSLNADGGYSVATEFGSLREEAPYSYVNVNGQQQEVKATFNVEGSDISFNVPAYDKSQTLVIDPAREWGSFHGLTGDDRIQGVSTQPTYNPATGAAYIYVCGATATTANTAPFATAGVSGVSTNTRGGTYDAFVAAYSYGTGARVYATAFGGNQEDRANGITTDPSGNAYVVGQTGGGSFPLSSSGNTQTAYGGDIFDGFVTSFNTTGQLTSGSYLGGLGDDYLNSICRDDNGNLTVGGYCAVASTGLSSGASVYQNTPGAGGYTGLISRIVVGTGVQRTWLSYYGTQNEVYIQSVASTNTAGEVWVGGFTNCPNTGQAIATTGSYNTFVNNNGSGSSTGSVRYDGVVIRMSNVGARVAATYVGGQQDDRVFGVANDVANNRVVAVGGTNSVSSGTQNIANTSGVFKSVLNHSGSTSNDDGFVTALTLSGSALSRAWGTYWGTAVDDRLYAVAVDNNSTNTGNPNNMGRKIFVAGESNAAVSGSVPNDFATYGTYNFSVTTNQTAAGAYDAVWSQVTSDGTGVELSTINGTTSNDRFTCIAVDSMRNIAVGGFSESNSASGNIGTGGTAQSTSAASGLADGIIMKYCNLIVPLTPSLSFNNGGSFSGSGTICLSNNSSAIGSTGLSGTGSCNPSGVQTLIVRVANAINGVTYRPYFAVTGTAVPAAPATTGYNPLAGAQTATSDGNLDFTISNISAAFGAAGTYDIFFQATTQASCAENGAVSTIIVAAQPGNNSIVHSDAAGTVIHSNNVAIAPNGGSVGGTPAINFIAVGSSTISVRPQSYVVGNTYSVCAYRLTGNASTPMTFTWSGPTSFTYAAGTNTFSLVLGDNAAAGDTIRIRMREVNVAGCMNEYISTFYVAPVDQVAVDLPTTGNNPNVMCSPSSSPATFSAAPAGTPYGSITFNYAAAPAYTYAWTTTSTGGGSGLSTGNAIAMNALGVTATFGTPSNESTTLSLAGVPSSAAIFTNVRLTETVTTGTYSGSKQYNKELQISAAPSISFPASVSRCEGTTQNITITVSPSLPAGSTWSAVLDDNGSTMTGESLVASSGTFTGTSFVVGINTGTVTSAYDALGTLRLSLIVTNSASGTCATNAGPTAVLSVTQNPDPGSSLNVANTNSSNPAAATPAATAVPGPIGSGTAFASPISTISSNFACLYEPLGSYGQTYTYTLATPNSGTGADTYTYSVTGGTITSSNTGADLFAINVQWTAAGSRNITLVQTNNQAPTNCQTTTVYPITVVNPPSPVTINWQNSGQYCEGQAIQFTVTNPNANQVVVQLYGETATVNGGGAWTPGFNSPQNVTVAGSSTSGVFTLTNSAAATMTTVTPVGSTDLTYRFVVRDNVTGCTAFASNAGSYTNFTSGTVRVWDTPATPVVGGPTPVCPAIITTNKNVPTNAVLILPPATDPGASSYSVTNTSSYPLGTTFSWSVAGGFVAGTDYIITNSSSGGYINNNATFRFGKNMIGARQIQIAITYPAPSSCALAATNAMAVTVSPVPTPGIIANTTNPNGALSLSSSPNPPGGLCSGSTAIYDAGVATGGTPYAWSISGSPTGTTTGAANTQTFTVNWGSFFAPALVKPVLTVVQQDASGCFQVDTASVYLRPVPQATVTQVLPVAGIGPCVFGNENAHIVAYTVPKNSSYQIVSVVWTISANGAIYSYTTTDNTVLGYTGVSAGANDTLRVQWNTPGAATVTATVTNLNNCSATFTLNTFVFPVPNPVISGASSLCKNTVTTYNVNPNVPGDSYTWEIIPSVAGNTFTTASSGVGVVSVGVNWSGAANTTYTLRCTQVSAQGCTARTTFNVTVNPNPTPAISGPTGVCANGTATYTTQNNAPTSAYVWTLTPGGGAGTAATIASGQNTASVVINTGSQASYSLTVQETITATSCSATTAAYSVAVAAAPTAIISRSGSGAVGSACTGVSYTYTATPTPSGVSYQWILNGTPLAGQTNNTYTTTWNATGSNTLGVMVTLNSTQCSTTVNQVVVVTNAPAPAISGPATVCGGGASPLLTYTYTTNLTAGNTYAWSFPSGGATAVTATSGTGVNSVTVSWSGTVAPRSVRVVETDPNTGCQTQSADYSVTVTTRPNPTLPTPGAACQNGATQNYTVSGLISGSTRTYVVTGGTFTVTSGATSDVVNVNWTAAGTGNVQITETNGACSFMNSFNVTVNPAPTAYNVSTSTPNVCATGGSGSNVTVASITLSGSQTGTNYQLVQNGTPLGTIGTADGTNVKAGNGSSLTWSITPGAAGVNNYTIVAQNTSTSCQTTMTGTAVVTVNANPSATITGSLAVCSGTSQVYSVVAAANQAYAWTVPAGWNVVSGANSNAITVVPNTTSGNVAVIVSNSVTGCSNNSAVTVTVTAAPTVFNVSPTTGAICLGNPTTLGLSGSATGVTYTVMKGSQTITTAAGTGSALTITIPSSAVATVGAHTFTVTALANSGACASTTINMNGSLTVTVNALPTPVISGPSSACIGQPVTFSTAASGNNFAWTISSGTGTIAAPTNTNSVSITFTGAAGSRTVQVVETNPNTGCFQSTTYTLTANATPAPSVTPGNSSVCAGTTVSYSTTNNVGNTYVWTVTGAGGQITSGQGQNAITVLWGNAAGTGTVTVTETAGTCTNSSSSTITVNAMPVAYTVNTTTPGVCVTGNAIITLSNSQAGFVYTLIRNGVAQTPTVTGTGGGIQFTNSLTAAGTYAYTVSATGAGCTNLMSGTATVTASTPPTPTITGATSVCANSSSTYAVTPVNAGSTYAFTVSGAGNTLGAQVGNQQTVNWGTNSGTLSVIETDANNCSGSASFAVTVNALPTAQTVTLSPTTICAAGGLGSNSTTATVGLANSQNGYTYELINSANNVVRTATGTGSALSFSPAFTNMTPGAFTWTVRAISNTTPSCTTATMANSVTLTVVPNPAPAVTGPTTPCQNGTVTYQTTNNTGSTYAWNIVSGTGSFTPTNTYQVSGSWSSIGTASIRVVETNANGCAQENILTVNVTTAPTPTITANPATSPVCGGSSVTYSTTAPGTTYNWTVGSGGTITSGTGTNSIVVSWANATPDVAYSSAVNLTVNNGGCTGSTSFPVTVNPKANPVITGDAARCSGQTGNYSTPFVVSGRSYTWSISNLPPGMSFAPITGTNLSTLPGGVNWVNTGTVPVVAVVQVVETPANSGNVCTGTSTFNVTVNPLPVVTITGPNQVCQNTTVSYTATPTQTGLAYAWNVTGANSFTGQGTATISVDWGSTNGTIQLTVTNVATGCTNTASNNNYAVTVTPTPTPGIATPPGTVACAGSTVTYNVLNPSSSFTYTWNNTGAVSASTPSGNSYTVTWPNTPGSGTITLTATTTGGVTCVGSTTRDITIAPNPAPSIDGNTAVCPNVDETYFTPFVANDTYQWSIPAGTYTLTGGSLTGNTVTVRWNNPGTAAATRVVTVTETSPNACVGVATVNVIVNPAPVPAVSGNTNVCGYMSAYDGVSINNTETYTVTNPVNSQSTFVWSMPNGGGTFVSSSQGVNVTSVTVQWNEPTASASLTRVLRVQETTNSIPTCTGQTDVNVQVNWNPKPAVTGSRVVCSNSQYAANSTNAQMYNSFTYATAGLNQTINPPASTYAWDVRNTSGVSILTSNPATATPGARITGSGNQVQVEYFNPTNAPVTMWLYVTETIQYTNALRTPSVKACPITDSFVVVVNPLPKPVIAPAPTDVCGRSTATYATTGDANSTFNWTVGTGTIVGAANANNVVITWNDVTADNTGGYVQVSQTFNATGCSTTVRQNLNVDVTPTPVITGPTVLCQGTTNGTNIGNYSIVTVLPNRAYSWSIDTPTSGPVTVTGGPNNLSTFQITVNGNTSVPVTCVIRVRETATDATNNGSTGGAGCFAETTYTVTLNPNPTPVITSSTGGLNVNGVCAGSTHTYATTLVAGNTYAWTVVGGSIVGASTNNTVSINWGAAGAGSIAVRERVGVNGCYTDVLTPITIRPLPNPDLTNQTGGNNSPSVCALSTTTYTTPFVAGDTYFWSVTGGTITTGQNTNTITVTWGAAGSGTVTVTETTPVTLGSCQASRTLAITINPLPTPSIQGPPQPPVCINSTQTYTTANIAGHTYVWGPVTGGNIVGANNTNSVNIVWTSAGNGTVTVTETITATGCTAATTRTILVNALPIVNITPSNTTNLCAGQSVTLAATDGFVSYTWSNGETTPRITVRQAGTYSVTVIDGNGCQNSSSSISVSVSSFTKPTMTLSGSASFCQGEVRTLTAVAVGGTPLSYRWNTGATTPSINVTTSGTYNCEITYSSTCKIMSDDVIITVSPKPVVTVTANGPITFCDGGSVTLDAGAGFTSYSWMNGTTNVGNGRTLKITTPGTYNVTVKNAGGCDATSTDTKVVVNPNPTPTIATTPDKTSFCEGDSVTLDAGPGYKTYSWSSGEKTQSIVVKTSGTFTVSVTDTNDCAGQSAAKKITVFQTPGKPGFTRVQNTLNADTTGKGYQSFQWIRNSSNISGATNASYTVTDTGSYQVRIVDRNGCSSVSDPIKIEIVISVHDPIFVEQNITLYPNPTNGNLNVRFTLDQDFNAAQLSVRNLVGSEVMSSTFDALNSGDNTRSIDMSRLPNGLYIVEIVMPNGQRLMARITKVD